MEDIDQQIDKITTARQFAFGETIVDGRKFRATLALVLVAFIALNFNLRQAQAPAILPPLTHKTLAMSRQIDPTRDQIRQLKEHKLWDITPDTEISPVIFSRFPENINQLTDVRLRKKVFLHTLLPVALIALDEVKHERNNLLAIIQKTGMPADELDFADGQTYWQDSLSDSNMDFIRRLTDKYRASQATVLLKRVDTVPVSLLLAQAAIESSWGGSRFARHGNNVFGIRTWVDRGLIPYTRDEGENHKVKTYESMIDSVRAYILTLNRLLAYKPFRELRCDTSDSLVLAEGLSNYSERGENYLEDLKNVILYNQLQKYDQCVLAEKETNESLLFRISGREPGYNNLL